MNLYKKFILPGLICIISMNSFAQKQTYDIVTYTPPAGWTPKQGNGYISYSRIDRASWAQIAIYPHRNSEGDIQTDFDKEWKELVVPGKTISGPEKTAPASVSGWTVMSGSGVWKYNGANVATILTLYSNNTICVSVLYNGTAQPYASAYKSLIASLDIDAGNALAGGSTGNPSGDGRNATVMQSDSTKSSATAAPASITGLWCDYTLETRGNSLINGTPQYTAGYRRKEYRFNPDGTYVFRNKQWLVTTANILFIYETGAYSVAGNQLTLTPKNGKSGYWAKAGSTKEWGRSVKSADYGQEKTTYAFEIIKFPGYGTSLVLKPAKPTVRDGGQFNAPNEPYEFHYSYKQESLIDNPPGFQPF